MKHAGTQELLLVRRGPGALVTETRSKIDMLRIGVQNMVAGLDSRFSPTRLLIDKRSTVMEGEVEFAKKTKASQSRQQKHNDQP